MGTELTTITFESDAILLASQCHYIIVLHVEGVDLMRFLV